MLFHAHPQLRDKTFKDKNTVWRPGDGSTPNTNWIRHPLPTIWNNRKYIWAQGRAWIRAEVRIDKVMITGRARISAGVRTDNVMITGEGRSKGWPHGDHRGGRGSAQEWGLTMWWSQGRAGVRADHMVITGEGEDQHRSEDWQCDDHRGGQE